MILTTDEDIEAKIIFIKSLLRLIDFGTAVYLAKDLERRDKVASNYLKFLLTNRHMYFHFKEIIGIKYTGYKII
jgi:hypothetical protein